MGRCLAFVVCFVVGATALADETIILMHSDGSASVVTLTADGGAKRVKVSAQRVIRTSGSPNDPSPPDSPSFATKVKSWYEAVTANDKPVNARKIAAVYRVVGEEAAKGTFENANEVGPTVGRLTDTVLGSDKDDWKEFRKNIGCELSSLGKS